MAKQKTASKEQIHLETERVQVGSELENLRAAMLNEVDTEPDDFRAGKDGCTHRCAGAADAGHRARPARD